MDFRLAKEIYGNAWCVDHITFQELSKTLKYYQGGGLIEKPETKGNSFGVLAKDNVFTPRQIENTELRGIEIPKNSIAQYNFDSVITKGGGASHRGTKEISAQFTEMEANDNIIGHMFVVESGGGSVNAIRYINKVAAKELRKKPLVTFFEDVNGSAAYVISANSDWIVANDKSAMVGSLGVMMEMEGFKNGTVDSDGLTHLRIYSNLSSEKNIEFEKALNDQNIELIQSNILDPSAEELIAHVVSQRPNITAKQKRAAIMRSEEAVGTLIDEIGTFQMAIDKVHELAGMPIKKQTKSTPKSGVNNNLNLNSMNVEQLKSEHPALYAQVFASGETSGKTKGVEAENQRVKSWMVFQAIAPEKVKAGIESGEAIGQVAMAEFSLLNMQSGKLTAMETENPGAVVVDTKVATAEQIKAKAEKEADDKVIAEFFNEETPKDK